MPRLFNVSAQHLTPVRITHRTEGDGKDAVDVVKHTMHAGPSVAPGDGFDFTDEEAVSIGAEWSTVDPRAGLEDEKSFKARRDSKTAASPAPENTESGSTGDTKEN